jgi:hypothetical protein
MQRVEFITHQGKRILLIDVSAAQLEEASAIMLAAEKIITAQPPHSLLTLMDVTHTRYNAASIKRLKEYTNRNKPFVRASAVVGIEGLMQVLLAGVEKFSGRKFNAFSSRAEALDWLVQQ